LLTHENFNCINSNAIKNKPLIDTLDLSAKIDSVVKFCDSVDNNLENLNLKKVEVNNFSSQGGEGIVYFDNNSVVKIMIILYGDIGSRKIAVYYRNQKIVRISDLLNKYDSNVHEGNVKISEKEFTDYYFSNSKLLTILKNHKNDENKVNDEESELEKTLELIDKVKVKI
jgi:DNA-binding LacI/PurR family transcriptional regulator